MIAKGNRRMRYGIPSLMEFCDVESHAAFAAANGFGFLELNMTYPWFGTDKLKKDSLRSVAEKYGIGYTLHLHDQLNPLDFCPEIRSASLEVIRKALDLAAALRLPRITMHLLPGMYSAVNGTKVYLNERCLDRYLSLADAFREEVASLLSGTGTLFCIENTGGFKDFQHKAIDRLLVSPCFGLTFDIGHNAKAGNADEDFMLGRSERLKHFHIHDCDASSNHLALGEGTLDLEKYLRLAKSLEASVLLEVKESGALLKSREMLKELGMWEA